MPGRLRIYTSLLFAFSRVICECYQNQFIILFLPPTDLLVSGISCGREFHRLFMRFIKTISSFQI